MGPIPASLGLLTKLIALDLGYNQLTGGIPPGMGSLRNISTLVVSHNQLSGLFPVEFVSAVRQLANSGFLEQCWLAKSG